MFRPSIFSSFSASDSIRTFRHRRLFNLFFGGLPRRGGSLALSAYSNCLDPRPVVARPFFFSLPSIVCVCVCVCVCVTEVFNPS